jgi:hypothetical protein
MFANAWLAMPDQRPGQYPCGGPVAHMIDIWRAAAPALELSAPDIYVDDFAGVCREYSRNGNPLLIPEVRADQDLSAKALYAFGEHGALCYSPFGIEDLGDLLPRNDQPCANPVAAVSWIAAGAEGTQLLVNTYEMLGEAMPLLSTYLGTERSRGVLQCQGETQTELTLGGIALRITYNHPWQADRPAAGGIIISPADQEFLVIGHGFRLDFALPSATIAAGAYYECGNLDFLEIREGEWRNGEFIRGRRLNGDEYAVCLGEVLGSRWVKLYQY